MIRHTITDIPFEITPEEAAQTLRVNEDDFDEFLVVYNETVPLLKPVLYFGEEEIHSNDGRNVVIGDQTFSSRILAVNIKDLKKVYPYVATSGRAAYDHAQAYDDPLYSFWAHGICELALRKAMSVGFEEAKARLGVSALNSMNPGSLSDFPISAQRPLFDLLKNVEEKSGVTLTDTFLMVPVKSGSGIWFESNKHYANCMMCPRVNCPSRRADYREDMFEAEYAEK
ncbi:MAG: vitamin B12 dependent methionine synthase [Clostridia bacterium]|nr:vitamin B12 dependent methionine synthase [Clostridia bacterium]